MSEVGVRALKQNASAVVRQAAAGEIITVTDRGRPVAQLTPLPSSKLQALIVAGGARPARYDLADLDEPPSGPPLSEVLAQARENERY
ncbi:type II toxin-antitoxin system Phd/YefM family antitoxin [Pseudactinotalea terrae]|uniref:type II toxin-antitoxin system Phd/YefM family antitoxin n=1 Tax=Pseudactinotalea terrae TaxID=1743262 RepID=UPI0012E1F2EC|nr:type II toxin-antitoxin system prevent-host-death family antitoxin [Pseudactinotalea terrae]